MINGISSNNNDNKASYAGGAAIAGGGIAGFSQMVNNRALLNKEGFSDSFLKEVINQSGKLNGASSDDIKEAQKLIELSRLKKITNKNKREFINFMKKTHGRDLSKEKISGLQLEYDIIMEKYAKIKKSSISMVETFFDKSKKEFKKIPKKSSEIKMKKLKIVKKAARKVKIRAAMKLAAISAVVIAAGAGVLSLVSALKSNKAD